MSWVPAFAFLDFIIAQRHTITQQGIPPDKVFQKLLHTVYVLNDVVFNHAHARTEGPYTMLIANSETINLIALLLPYLPNILRQSYEAATTDAERGKIERVIRIWGEKGLVPPGEVPLHPHSPILVLLLLLLLLLLLPNHLIHPVVSPPPL